MQNSKNNNKYKTKQVNNQKEAQTSNSTCILSDGCTRHVCRFATPEPEPEKCQCEDVLDCCFTKGRCYKKGKKQSVWHYLASVHLEVG